MAVDIFADFAFFSNALTMTLLILLISSFPQAAAQRALELCPQRALELRPQRALELRPQRAQKLCPRRPFFSSPSQRIPGIS